MAVSCTAPDWVVPHRHWCGKLIRIGAKNIIRIGTCGVIQPFIKPGSFIMPPEPCVESIPVKNSSIWNTAVADYRIVRALIDACEKLDMPYHLGIVRTHDAYYLESPEAQGNFYGTITTLD